MAGIFRLIVKPFSFLVTLYYPEAFVFAVLTNKPMVRVYCGPMGHRLFLALKVSSMTSPTHLLGGPTGN